jgi:hypothetical protein
MLKSAKDVLASGDVGAIVDFAIQANREVKSAKTELGSVKGHLRSLAEAEKGKNPKLTSVVFDGLLGTAQVVLGKKVASSRKGMNLHDLKHTLPPGLYRCLFEERTVVEIRDGWEDNYAELNPAQRLVVDRYVEFEPQTPRVNLPE